MYISILGNTYCMKSSKEIITILKKDGWYLLRVTGSHNHFAHDEKEVIVTVPHPKKDIPIGTIKSIEKQSGTKIL